MCLSAERAKKVFAAAQDAKRDLQQGRGDYEEAEEEVARCQQERTRHGQGAQEHADPRGGEVQARRLLRAELEKCTPNMPYFFFLTRALSGEQSFDARSFYFTLLCKRNCTLASFS